MSDDPYAWINQDRKLAMSEGKTIELEPGQTVEFDAPAPLTDHERELLIHLAQEASEVAQAVTKMLLFGRVGTSTLNGQTYDNVHLLSLEIGNLHHMCEEVHPLGLITSRGVLEGIDRKRVRLAQHLRHPAP